MRIASLYRWIQRKIVWQLCWWTGAPLALRLGVVLTYYWVVGIATYVAWNTRSFEELKPNEMGDFFAGAFAPLAFLWLLVAVLLQKQELELQRAELRQSRQALELQAAETRSLVDQNRRAVEIAFEELLLERSRGEEQRLISEMEDIPFGFREIATKVHLEERGRSGSEQYIFGNPETHAGPTRDAIQIIIRAVEKSSGSLWSRHFEVKDGSTIVEDIKQIRSNIQRIIVEAEPYPVARSRSNALNLATLVDRLDGLAVALLL